MPIRKDGRYKKPIRWMRQVNRDRKLDLVPHQIRGGGKTFDRNAVNLKWTKQICIDCGGDAWVTARAVHKWGKRWRCRKCKDAGRHECILAALAVAKRKQEMGIK